MFPTLMINQNDITCILKYKYKYRLDYHKFKLLTLFFTFVTLPLFYIWAPAPEELSARPWAEVYGICIIICDIRRNVQQL